MTPEITLFGYLTLGLLVLGTFALLFIHRVPKLGGKLWAMVRMTLQLGLLGLYLGFLFDQNIPWLNLAWFVVMVMVAGWSNYLRMGKKDPSILLGQVIALLISGSIHTLVFTFFIIALESPFDARFLIPVGGMLLGNSLRGNFLANQNLLKLLQSRRREWDYWIALGAPPAKLSLKYRTQALSDSLDPLFATLANTGLISIPGMMTGQLLGGNLPFTAVTYQLAIMLGILSAQLLSSALSLWFLTNTLLDKAGRFRARHY
jgi:putative ABC transport system permease protein